MLLEHDGLTELGADLTHWKIVDADEAKRIGIDRAYGNRSFVQGRQGRDDVGEPDVEQVQDGWDEKREILRTHYNVALNKGEVHTLITTAKLKMRLMED